MLEVIRLATVHPALVHFTLGTLPLLIFAYAVAAWRRSERWTFAADVALVTTAVLTIGTGAFGLVSNALVPWPGGLQFWRWLHLCFGIASTLLLLAFAGFRILERRRGGRNEGRDLVAASVVAVFAAFTGWIGGEVLVYHSGVAVRAAGDGALAPPIGRPEGLPRDLGEAMDRLRPAWASVTTHIASMVVEKPTERHFAAVIEGALSIRALATWMAAGGGKGDAQPLRPVSAPEKTDEPGADAADRLRALANELDSLAESVEHAARTKDLQRLATLTGQMTAVCAHCHEQVRFRTPPEGRRTTMPSSKEGTHD